VIGSNIATVSGLINQTILDNPLDDISLQNHLNSLRSIPGALVSTYTYAPLIGITSETDSKGMTTYYEYDAFNRLKLIRDKDKHIVKQFEYKYGGIGTSAYSAEDLRNTENDFNQTKPGGMRYSFFTTQPNQKTFSDTRDIFRDGVAKLPEEYRTQPANFYSALNIVPNYSNPCFLNEYAVEWRLKMPAWNGYNKSMYFLDLNGDFNAIFRDEYFGPFSGGTYLVGYRDFDGHISGSDNNSVDFDHIQVNPGQPAAHMLNDFHNVKLQITATNYNVYFDGVRIYQRNRNPATAVPGWFYADAAFLGNDGSVDYIKVYDGQGNLQYSEDFSDPQHPARINPSSLCAALPDCQQGFTNYFNARFKPATPLTYSQIATLYQQTLGETLNVCN